MKRKNSPSKPTFTELQIELMKDVTKSHKALEKRFGKSIALIQAYRRDNLGIYLRGLNYKLESIQGTVDWRLNNVSIARVMKVSPETIARWRIQLFGKPTTRVKLSDEQRREIAESVDKSTKLAVKYGVTVWTINCIRRQAKTTKGMGRSRLTLLDFPADTNWSRPARQIAKNLGISWPTADRLRTEALLQSSYLPIMRIPLNISDIPDDQILQSTLNEIDWTESTSLLSTHLKLDKHEVSRLKSTAQRQRRKTKVA